MKVFTYYEPIAGLADPMLLHQWSESWKRCGWEPAILTRDDAKAHPFYHQFNSDSYFAQTINPVEYERACFLRWLAMVNVGGGLMSDWDVINYGFQPHDLARIAHDRPAPWILSGKATPCLVFGTDGAYQSIAAAFHVCAKSRYQVTNADKNTVSDQNILMELQDLFDTRHVCYEPDELGWQDSKLVHYPNRLVSHPRSQQIPILRAA